MSATSINSETDSSGHGCGINNSFNNFREELSEAFANNLNLKTHQDANEKILRNIVASARKSVTLKQAVQARAVWMTKQWTHRGSSKGRI